MTTTEGSKSDTLEKAKEIMGKNFLGIAEAVKCFRLTPTDEEIDYLHNIPFSEETLLRYNDTHILVAIFSCSIINIIYQEHLKNFFLPENNWFQDENFAKKQSMPEWKLICKTPITNSVFQMWSDQQNLLGKDHQVPTAQNLIYITVENYLINRGEKLFRKYSGRSIDTDERGDRVHVGFHECGIIIGKLPDCVAHPKVGLACCLNNARPPM